MRRFWFRHLVLGFEFASQPMRTLVFAALLVGSSQAKQPDKPFAPKAAEPKPDTFTVKDLRVGKQLGGPKFAADDLKGTVVVVEFWGVNCPRCLAALPETAALHADLNPFGLVVIGAHCHKAPPEYVNAVAAARGGNFPITELTAIAGDDIPELPYAVVFDHTGACVFRGSPRDAEVKARRAVGAMLVSNTGHDAFPPQLAAGVAELKKGQSPHLVLPKVVAQLGGPAAEDAKALLKSLTAVGQKKYDRAKAQAGADAVGAFLLVEAVPAAYKGTPLATDAAALAVVKRLGTRLALDAGTGKPTDATLLRQLREAVSRMQKDWPTTRATAEAVGIKEQYQP